ncbi:MAG: branched-chain amino acid ABC transporter permease [Rubrivivax sp.]
MFALELTLQGLINGSTYALIAVGLTLVYGLLRILHVAHAGLFALGAYLTVSFAQAFGSVATGLAAACLVVGLAGVAVYRLLYEPILAKPPFVALVASIGLFILMQEALRIVFGPYGLSFAVQPLGAPVRLGGFTLRQSELLTLGSTALLFGALALFTRFTRAGVGMRATVSDPQVAWSFGVSPRRTRDLCFFIASMMAAYSGGLVAVLNNLVEPTMGAIPSYKMLAIIVLGGLGSVLGTVLASLGLGVVEAFGTIYIDKFVDRDAIAFLALIAVLVLRPEGLALKSRGT